MVGPLKGAWLCLSILSAITKRRHHTFETVTLGTIYHVYLCLVSQLICVLPASHSVHSSHTFKDIVLLCVTCHLSLSRPDFLHHCVINLWQFAYPFLCLHSHKALSWVLSESETVSPHTHTHIYRYLQTPPPLQNVDCLGLATMLTGQAPLSTSTPIPKIFPL